MIVLLWFGVMLSLVLTGCTTTIKPVKVSPGVASFDGTNLNSGVISFDKLSGTGNVTEGWREAFNSLAAIYQKHFLRGLPADHGLTRRADGTWTATAESFEDYGFMLLWRRNGVK